MKAAGIAVFLFFILISNPFFGNTENIPFTGIIKASELHAQVNDQEDKDPEWGESDDFVDDDVKIDVKKQQNESFFHFGGFFKEKAAYSYQKDEPGFTMIRSTLNLGIDLKFSESWKSKLVWNGFYDSVYRIRGRDDYEDETLDTYEYQSEIRDFYIDGVVTSWLRLKLGRQIIAWGETEFFQLIDLANPRDQRELIEVDLEDARIPVASAKLSLVGGPFELNMVSIHEVRANKTGGKGSDFDPYVSIRNQGIEIEKDETPDNKISNTEYLARIFGSFSIGDFSLVFADVYDDNAHLDLTTLSFVEFNPYITLTPEHKRIRVYGFSGNIVTGTFLWKMEGSNSIGKAVPRDDLVQQIAADPTGSSVKTWDKKDVVQGMAGVEYTGITDLTIIFEGSLEHILDYDDYLYREKNEKTVSMLITYKLLNETLEFNLLWRSIINDKVSIVRLGFDYNIIDALELGAGIAIYYADEKDSPYYPVHDKDRVFASIKYSF